MGKTLRVDLCKQTAILWLFLAVIPAGAPFAQTSLSIGEQTHCQANELQIPVYASEFLDINAMTFYIELDTLQADFVDVDNIHPELGSGTLVANFAPSNARITIVWYSIIPVNVEEGVLFDIILEPLGKEDIVLAFDESSEIILSDDTVMEDISYEDGLISAVDLSISQHPEPVEIDQDEDALFSISLANGEGMQYFWQQHNGNEWINVNHDDDQFTGAHTSQLVIHDVTNELDSTAWRCKAYVDYCSVHSDAAVLRVNQTTNTPEIREKTVRVYPNPATDVLFYITDASWDDTVIKMCDVQGETVLISRQTGQAGSIDVARLSPGVYFLQFNASGKTGHIEKIIIR